jgi:hypothetical protein
MKQNESIAGGGASMAHNITVLESGILEIVHTGKMTVREAHASRDEAGPMMKARGLRRVLTDVSRTNHDDSTMDLFKFNSTHYDVFPRGTRIAVVIPPESEHRESAQFAETVASNRGISMKTFLTYEDAKNWLVETGIEETEGP